MGNGIRVGKSRLGQKRWELGDAQLNSAAFLGMVRSPVLHMAYGGGQGQSCALLCL